MADSPLITVIVVIYKMARQAANTLYTLSTAYQRHVNPADYEVIVVENQSDDILGESAARAFGSNFSYFIREEKSVSPAAAINFGFEQSRSPMICLMIDGARMVSPRILEYARYAHNISPTALVAVPGYHLGPNEQTLNKTYHYDETVEQELLNSIDWKQNGYRLFEISSFSGANRNGFFSPMMECNCLFCSRESFIKIGRVDERFDLPGGGILNLELFRAVLSLPEIRFFVLPGEGSFHQFHQGVTTRESEHNQSLFEAFIKQYESLRGKPLQIFPKEPMLLGAVTGYTQRFVQHSAQKALTRFNRLNNSGQVEWPNG